jgi:hypothetical protein
MAVSKKPKREIEPHPLVAALQPDPSKPPMRTVKLFGFPGTSMDPSMTRLWLDTDLLNYVDIPSDEIHHSMALPDDGGTIVWVSPDAQLTYGSTTDAATAGQFLTGAIASSYFAGAASASAAGTRQGPVPEGISLGGPCNSLPVVCNPSIACPSQIGCHPTVATCHSVVVVCISQPIPCNITAIACPSQQIACHPTVAACHSVLVVCITQPNPCNISAFACPSLQFVCPTRPIVCQISAVVVCPTRLCPSTAIPCFSAPCPSAACPSLACGEPGGFGGQ